MVQALIEGRKTQTRRLRTSPLALCEAGDLLYVRESAWIAPPGWSDVPANPMGPKHQEVAYAADDRKGGTREAARDYKIKLAPSIHLPRWASRLTLEVTDVRFDRLQMIRNADIRAEGFGSPVEMQALWDALHGDGSWRANPEIVALTFTVHRTNIDQMMRAA